MPVQEELTAELPWDALAEARQRLDDALRAAELAGDELDAAMAGADAEEARAEYDRAAEHLAALGALLLLYAVERGCVAKATLDRLSEALGFSLCFDMARKANRRTAWAEARAMDALEKLDAIRVRVAELERRVDGLTPGVGDPVADAGAERPRRDGADGRSGRTHQSPAARDGRA